MSDPGGPVHTVRPQELTAEAFAPYGEVMSLEAVPKLPINFYSGRNAVHGPIRIDSDTPAEFLVFRVGVRGDAVRYLERHVEMAQTMIPLGGHPYVAVVAPPGAVESNGFPDMEEIKAFYVPGDVSVNLFRGTWHEPPFPSRNDQMFLITSHERLTRGLQEPLNADGELNEYDVEKRNPLFRTGLRVRVELP